MPSTKKFHVIIVARTLETYEVEADSEVEAEELWAEGRLIRTDDGALECEVLSIKEA